MVMSEIGGHLAHQLPLHNHTQTGLQTTLLMDLDCHRHDEIKKQRLSLCVGCGEPIRDQYILHVEPDLEWHAACLKCQECQQFLDESCTCFVRGGKTYCKRDYVRDKVSDTFGQQFGNDCCLSLQLRRNGIDILEDSGSESSSHKSIGEKTPSPSTDGKPTRARTVLNEKQLHTLTNCYNANPRPDALMKELLVEMTGLSSRVISVWFQNKRCKNKKEAIKLKLQVQQEKDFCKSDHHYPHTSILTTTQSDTRNLNRMPILQTHQQVPLKTPPGHYMNGSDVTSMKSGIISHHNMYSTDPYVTYVERNDSKPSST